MKVLVCDFPPNWDTCLGDGADWCRHHKRLPHYEEVKEEKQMISLPKRYTLTYSVTFNSRLNTWEARSDKINAMGFGETPDEAVVSLDNNLDKMYYAKETI